MNCQRCGQQLRPGQAVCVFCGTPTGQRVLYKPAGMGCIPLVLCFIVAAVILFVFAAFAIHQLSQ